MRKRSRGTEGGGGGGAGPLPPDENKPEDGGGAVCSRPVGRRYNVVTDGHYGRLTASLA